MRALGTVLLLAAFAASGAEAPEAVYGKFHRAIATGNLEEVMKHAPAARRAELAGMSQAQKDAQIKMLSVMLPIAFTLMNKTLSPDGKQANLVVTGPGKPIIAGAAPEKLYGQVKMITEGGEWKVEEASWSNERPATPAQAQAPAKPAAAAKPVAAKASAAPSSPAPTLGPAKPACIYKPVMTNEDMERCR